jgi:hypothetical protein
MFDPLNEEAAKLMGRDENAFKAKVKRTFEGGNVDGYLLSLFLYDFYYFY